MRNQYKTFSYDSYKIEQQGAQLHLTFNYSIEGLSSFTHHVTIETTELIALDSTVNFLAFTIGIAEACNYWKLTASENFSIRAGNLSTDQITSWTWVFTHGMSEYHYKNNLDFAKDSFIKITSTGSAKSLPENEKLLSGEMILSGGGKDSSVTLELLHETSSQQAAFVLETNTSIESAQKIAQINNYPMIKAQRILDPQLFSLNKEQFYNGHIPFSLVLGLIAILTAYVRGFKYVIASNESSANEATLLWNGIEVNHQVAKTIVMENKLRSYVQNLKINLPEYFSFLRPLSELQIAWLFSHFPAYHTVAKSCNVGQKTNSWCGNCSKCAFSYALFFPFIPYKTMISIFGSDLFTNATIMTHLRDNAGLTDKKPLECVGTIEETRDALILCKAHYLKQNIEIPHTFFQLITEIEHLTKRDSMLIESEIKKSWVRENNVPEKYASILKSSLHTL